MKRIFYGDFLHSKLLGTPHTIFNVIIRVLFTYVAIQNPRRLSIFETSRRGGNLNAPWFLRYRNIEQKVAEAETCERV